LGPERVGVDQLIGIEVHTVIPKVGGPAASLREPNVEATSRLEGLAPRERHLKAEVVENLKPVAESLAVAGGESEGDLLGEQPADRQIARSFPPVPAFDLPVPAP
jgi:hypothetical protein